MTQKAKKSVLIVDDNRHMGEELRDGFTDCNKKVDCPYEFEVDLALSAAECVRKVCAKSLEDDTPYDVIVLDVRMEDETSGLHMAFELHQQLGWEVPVKIIFTGFPDWRQCVQAMRHGVWDYIRKEDVGETPAAQVVVDSALTRLRQLDLRQDHEQRIAADWLPRNLWRLLPEYGGQLVAIWRQPEVAVIASGADAFELEANLRTWREQHLAWEQPFIVQIPPPRATGKEGDK